MDSESQLFMPRQMERRIMLRIAGMAVAALVLCVPLLVLLRPARHLRMLGGHEGGAWWPRPIITSDFPLMAEGDLSAAPATLPASENGTEW